MNFGLFIISVLVVFEQLSSDQPLSDFSGSTTDIVEFGVTKKSSAWIFIYITVTSIYLDALLSAFDCTSACLQEYGGTLNIALHSRVKHGGCAVYIGSCGLGHGVHIGKFSLENLEFTNFLTELLSFGEVVERDIN